MSRKTTEGRAQSLAVLLRNNEFLGFQLEECLTNYFKLGGSDAVSVTVIIQDRSSPDTIATAHREFDLTEPED